MIIFHLICKKTKLRNNVVRLEVSTMFVHFVIFLAVIENIGNKQGTFCFCLSLKYFCSFYSHIISYNFINPYIFLFQTLPTLKSTTTRAKDNYKGQSPKYDHELLIFWSATRWGHILRVQLSTSSVFKPVIFLFWATL